MIKVKPLTVAERRWVDALEKLLANPPTKRLALFTIGDSHLTVIDNDVTLKHDLDIHDGWADKNGVVVGHIFGNVMIHGVSG